jgi:hypothetical protein
MDRWLLAALDAHPVAGVLPNGPPTIGQHAHHAPAWPAQVAPTSSLR